VLIYIVGSIAGFALSSAATIAILWLPPGIAGILRYFPGFGYFTLGASAAITGLWGALLYYSQRTGSSILRSWVLTNLFYLGIFGLMMRGVDNWAHLGGFVGGWIAARMLDPLQPERTSHIIGAILCLVASVVSVLASLYIPVPPRG